MGNPFMVRQSYLPHELHWGHTFQSIIGVPPKGETRYTVDMTRCQPAFGLKLPDGTGALSPCRIWWSWGVLPGRCPTCYELGASSHIQQWTVC